MRRVQEGGVMLPNDIARCPGYGTDKGQPDAACLDCARRTEGLRDYMAGSVVAWMDAPKETPCPMRLEPAK